MTRKLKKLGVVFDKLIIKLKLPLPYFDCIKSNAIKGYQTMEKCREEFTEMFSQEEIVTVSQGNVQARKKNCMIYINNCLRLDENRECLVYRKVTN